MKQDLERLLPPAQLSDGSWFSATAGHGDKEREKLSTDLLCPDMGKCDGVALRVV